MKAKYSVSRGQAQFPTLCRRNETTPITGNGEVGAFIVPRSRMPALLEQMEILANPEAMKPFAAPKPGEPRITRLKPRIFAERRGRVYVLFSHLLGLS